jgi:hypothetical protein
MISVALVGTQLMIVYFLGSLSLIYTTTISNINRDRVNKTITLPNLVILTLLLIEFPSQMMCPYIIRQPLG